MLEMNLAGTSINTLNYIIVTGGGIFASDRQLPSVCPVFSICIPELCL